MDGLRDRMFMDRRTGLATTRALERVITGIYVRDSATKVRVS